LLKKRSVGRFDSPVQKASQAVEFKAFRPWIGMRLDHLRQIPSHMGMPQLCAAWFVGPSA
jgi:hypothetical protein